MRTWYLVALLLVAVGCGDANGGADGGSGGAGGSGATGGSGGTGGTGGSGGAEVVPTDETDTGWTPVVPAALDGELLEEPRPASCGSEFGFISAVRGWTAAPGGKPLEEAKAQLCIRTDTGRLVCLRPADTDANGVYTVEIPEEYRCLEKVAMRVLQPATRRTTSYCLMDPAAGPAVRLYEPSVLPYTPAAIELPPEGDENAPRDVVFDDGLVLEVTPKLYYSSIGSYDRLSGRRVPNDAVGLCGDAPSFDGLYAFYPEGVISAPGFGLQIPNEDGYAAGSTVELFVLGGLDCRLFGDNRSVPEATWAKFGEARVADDERMIVSDPGVGLPCFTWLGYRLKE